MSSSNSASAITRPSLIPDIPAEILIIMYDYMDVESRLSFSIASWGPLQRRGMVPPMTRSRLLRLISSAVGHRLLPLPAELLLAVLADLTPYDQITLVMADWDGFASCGIAPVLTPETLLALVRLI